MQIKIFLLTGILCMLLSASFSQSKTSKIIGKITDEGGLPVPGALIKIQNNSSSAVSDVDGIFKIEKLSAGNYSLTISSVGMVPRQKQVSLKEGAVVNVNISLVSNVQKLEAVRVLGKTKAQEIRESGFAVNAIETKKLANTTSDLNQILNRTTGVRVRESGGMGSTFNFSLNGFSGNQIKFFMDGIPIDNYGSSFTLNNIPVNMAERIDVYKGVVPIELGGDALGGAVNIITNKNAKRYIDASFSTGSFNTHKAAINMRFGFKNGFILNLNTFANYSDNNYKVDVSVADPFSGAFGPVQKYNHFHGGYKQAAITAELGVKDRQFADYLLFGLTGSANTKEIQQGATMLAVIGDAFTESSNFVPSIKYKKTNFFTKNLTASLAASYNIAEERSVDTSSARFDWAGNSSVKNYQSGGEINPDEKVIMVFDINAIQSNTNFKYDLNENNYLSLNHTFIGYQRKENNQYDPTYKSSKPSVDKNIVGFSYNLSAFERRLSYTAFTKILGLNTKVIDVNDKILESTFNDVGYGTAAAYFLIPDKLQIKASYEHAYRLQSADELLGNGLLILPNPDLKAESSDNINLGFSFKKAFVKHSFGIQSNLVYRDAKDFIQSRAQGINSVSVNSKNVRVTGIDGGIQYGFKNWLTFAANATYQKTVDMNPNGQYGTNQVNYLYKKQLPNIPIFYGNADLGFYFKRVKYFDDLLSVNLLANFYDSYYLTYPSLGAPEYKKEIPRQLFYSTALAYSLKNGRYNLAVECRNITDAKLYDYFNVQKPGRSFMLKLRYAIH